MKTAEYILKGKTWLVGDLIENSSKCFTIPPKRVVVCYNSWQDIYADWKKLHPNVKLQMGPVESRDITKDDLITLDDMAEAIVKSTNYSKLFTGIIVDKV